MTDKVFSFQPSQSPATQDNALSPSLVHAPSHYVEGRSIESYQVLERWNLVQHHYLACAFKYLARAGRKEDAILDLNKALWYLGRFETLDVKLDPMSLTEELAPLDLFADWGFSEESFRAQALWEVYAIARCLQRSTRPLQIILQRELHELRE